MNIAIALIVFFISSQMMIFMWMRVFKDDQGTSIQKTYVNSWRTLGNVLWTLTVAPFFEPKK